MSELLENKIQLLLEVSGAGVYPWPCSVMGEEPSTTWRQGPSGARLTLLANPIWPFWCPSFSPKSHGTQPLWAWAPWQGPCDFSACGEWSLGSPRTLGTDLRPQLPSSTHRG